MCGTRSDSLLAWPRWSLPACGPEQQSPGASRQLQPPPSLPTNFPLLRRPRFRRVSQPPPPQPPVADDPGEGAIPAQPDTTIVEPTPAELAAIKLDPAALPGSRVAEGWMDFVVDFKESPARSCSGRIPVVPETQLNAVDGEGGRIGALYGTAPADKGTVGVFLVGLKAMPIGIAVLSGSNANCEFDAIGLGSFTSSNSEVHLDGIGLGLHPDAYDNGDFVRKFKSMPVSFKTRCHPCSRPWRSRAFPPAQTARARDRASRTVDLSGHSKHHCPGRPGEWQSGSPLRPWPTSRLKNHHAASSSPTAGSVIGVSDSAYWLWPRHSAHCPPVGGAR